MKTTTKTSEWKLIVRLDTISRIIREKTVSEMELNSIRREAFSIQGQLAKLDAK